MTDFLYRFDNAINIDINLAICLVGITGLLALLAPLSAWEMRNSNNSNQNLTAGCGFVKLLTASLTAWIVDAALFAVPAMTLVALVHIFPMQLFGSSPQMPFVEDLTGNPASLLIKCFMVALNPFWFVVVQLLGFTGEQAYPYKGTFGQSLKVSIEAAVPLALFLSYQVLLNGSRFKGTVGTLLVDHLNQVPVHTTSVVGLIIDFFKSALFGLSKVFAILRHNGHQSNSQNLYPSPALTTARKTRWFVVALSSFFLISLVQIQATLEKVRRVRHQTTFALANFSREGTTPAHKLEIALALVASLQDFYCPNQKAHALKICRDLAIKNSYTQLLPQIDVEQRFVNTGSWLGTVRDHYYE